MTIILGNFVDLNANNGILVKDIYIYVYFILFQYGSTLALELKSANIFPKYTMTTKMSKKL
jgi:hypothetical protein